MCPSDPSWLPVAGAVFNIIVIASIWAILNHIGNLKQRIKELENEVY